MDPLLKTHGSIQNSPTQNMLIIDDLIYLGKPISIFRCIIHVEPELFIDRILKEGLQHIHCAEVTGVMVIDHTVRDYCTLPYPGHPHGCPHYGKNEECPPHAPFVEDFIDVKKPHHIIIAVFTNRLEHEHYTEEEELQENQILHDLMNRIQQVFPGIWYTLKPSALGIDVYKTATALGFSMNLHHNYQKRVVFFGYPQT